jgi:hypothetical protein
MRKALERIALFLWDVAFVAYALTRVLIIPLLFLACLILDGLKYLDMVSGETGERLRCKLPLETRHRMILLATVVCSALPVALVIALLSK